MSKSFEIFFIEEINDITPDVKKVIFVESFIGDIELHKLPKWIEEIEFEADKNIEYFPLNIKKITFGGNFNRVVENIPIEVTNLTFGDKFNQPVNNLPRYLTHLYFGEDFNQEVNNLPESITHLHFGNKFNKPIDNLPIWIVEIKFGLDFKQSLANLSGNVKKIILNPLNLFPLRDVHKNVEVLDLFSEKSDIDCDVEKYITNDKFPCLKKIIVVNNSLYLDYLYLTFEKNIINKVNIELTDEEKEESNIKKKNIIDVVALHSARCGAIIFGFIPTICVISATTVMRYCIKKIFKKND